MQQAVPFPIRLPRQAGVQLEDVFIPALPGVSAHGMKEAHPDWRYVELQFSGAKGGGFLLNESNGGMGVAEGGESFTLAGRPATYVQGGLSLLLVDLGTLRFVIRSSALSRAEMEEVAQNVVHDDGKPTIRVAELVTHFHVGDWKLQADVEQDRVLLHYLAQLVGDAERLDDPYLKPLSIGVPGGRNQLTITYADKRTSNIERAYRCNPDDPTACTGTAPDDIVVIDSHPAKSAQLAAILSGDE